MPLKSFAPPFEIGQQVIDVNNPGVPVTSPVFLYQVKC